MRRGHYIFRNQPSYRIFNKSLDNPNDIMYQQLNEIDPFFFSDEQLQDKSYTLPEAVIDPRTNKELECATYYHNEPKLFQGAGIKSTLTKAQQETCLRVLLGWQERTEINENDIIIWRQLFRKITKEREYMQQHISDYTEKNKDAMYAPVKRLNEFYRQWYKRKANVLLQQNAVNIAFNTRVGLPHVSVCKGTIGEKAEICDVQLLERSGWIRIDSAEKEIDWRNFNFRLESYVDRVIDSIYENRLESRVTAELNHFEEDTERNCYLPFDTLLFLLTAGDYVDIPSECLLEISDVSEDSYISIKFDSPIPARNCGWHTQQNIVEQAYAAFLSVKGRSMWMKVKNGTSVHEKLTTDEIHAVNEREIAFQPMSFEKYLENNKNSITSMEEPIKTNSALLKWYLKAPDSTGGLKILTTLALPSCKDEQANLFLAHETIKIEYKSQYGCEMLTKYELLRAWLKMRLLTNSTRYGICYRLSSINCDLELKEKFTLDVVENYLKQYYHVNPSQLIANLAEFLKILLNMPAGKYMLRYNPKYKEQLLLCEPTDHINQNTVYLHSLIQTEPTDMDFMRQPQYLPILDNLCSRVHLKHKILPLAFQPVQPHLKNRRNLQTPAARANANKRVLEKNETAALEIQKAKFETNKDKKRPNKNKHRQRKRKDNAASEKQQTAKDDEINKLLKF